MNRTHLIHECVNWRGQELGIKAKVVTIDFLSDKSATKNPDLLAVNPSGR